MALKLVRFIGSITLGDDNASGIEIGKLGGGSVFRISEFGGQDIFFKITLNSDRTAVTATNGMYLKASTSITVVPEEIIKSGEGKVLLDEEPTSVEKIHRIVGERLRSNDKLIVSVKAHPKTAYSDYVIVIDQLKIANAKKISIANSN